MNYEQADLGIPDGLFRWETALDIGVNLGSRSAVVL